MRQGYAISQKQLDILLDASEPVPVMYLPGDIPMRSSPQENANAAWRKLGAEMGFHWDTVQPVPGCSNKHFTAEPTAEGGA